MSNRLTRPTRNPDHPYALHDAALQDAARNWLEARAAEAEWRDRAKHFENMLLTGLPEGTRRIALDGNPIATVVTRTVGRFDRGKFDAEYPGLYEQYMVPGIPSTYLRRL